MVLWHLSVIISPFICVLCLCRVICRVSLILLFACSFCCPSSWINVHPLRFLPSIFTSMDCPALWLCVINCHKLTAEKCLLFFLSQADNENQRSINRMQQECNAATASGIKLLEVTLLLTTPALNIKMILVYQTEPRSHNTDTLFIR